MKDRNQGLFSQVYLPKQVSGDPTESGIPFSTKDSNSQETLDALVGNVLVIKTIGTRKTATTDHLCSFDKNSQVPAGRGNFSDGTESLPCVTGM